MVRAGTIKGRGNYKSIDTSGDAAARRYTRTTDTGKIAAYNASETEPAFWQTGDDDVDLTDTANMEGLIPPGGWLPAVDVSDGTSVSFHAATGEAGHVLVHEVE